MNAFIAAMMTVMLRIYKKNNRSDKSVHSSSDDSNEDSGHNNKVEAREKITGMGKILYLSASLIFGVWWILIFFPYYCYHYRYGKKSSLYGKGSKGNST